MTPSQPSSSAMKNRTMVTAANRAMNGQPALWMGVMTVSRMIFCFMCRR
jgi:hypothetical protein